MSGSAEFVKTEVSSRIADLGFEYLRPKNFHPLDLPEEAPKFEDPAYFMPLHVCMAGYGAVVFTVSARPAYDDGTVEDWLRRHAERQLGKVMAIRPGTIGDLRVMTADAVQPSDVGSMHFRGCFLEDGARLIIVGAMAPEQLWSTLEPMLQTMISSFRLRTPKGQRAALMRGEAPASAPPVDRPTWRLPGMRRRWMRSIR